MKDFQNGWSGLKDYAVSCGVAEEGDGDDAVAAKIKAVIQGTLPESEEVEEKASEDDAEGGDNPPGSPMPGGGFLG